MIQFRRAILSRTVLVWVLDKPAVFLLPNLGSRAEWMVLQNRDRDVGHESISKPDVNAPAGQWGATERCRPLWGTLTSAIDKNSASGIGPGRRACQWDRLNRFSLTGRGTLMTQSTSRYSIRYGGPPIAPFIFFFFHEFFLSGTNSILYLLFT